MLVSVLVSNFLCCTVRSLGFRRQISWIFLESKVAMATCISDNFGLFVIICFVRELFAENVFQASVTVVSFWLLSFDRSCKNLTYKMYDYRLELPYKNYSLKRLFFPSWFAAIGIVEHGPTSLIRVILIVELLKFGVLAFVVCSVVRVCTIVH